MIPETLALAETVPTYHRMRKFYLPLCAIMVNQVMQTHQQDAFWRQRADRQQGIIRELDIVFADCNRYYMPLQADDIRGFDQLVLFCETSVRIAAAGNHRR